MAKKAHHDGFKVGPGTGKFRFRIRQRHVADHYAQLIAGKAYGAAKLDLVLRCIALSPQHAGDRDPGWVLRDWTYEDLHDLVKELPPNRAGTDRSDQATRHLKRKWVALQLDKLAKLGLVTVTPRSGTRSEIVVLRDDGSTEPFDDPGAQTADLYFTVQGSLIAFGVLRRWTASEFAAYFAALLAEFHSDRGGGRSWTPGTGEWWRPLAWFNHEHWFPAERVRLPFSKSLLEEGFRRLEDDELVTCSKILRDPRDKRKLYNPPRNSYRNRFTKYDQQVRVAAGGGGRRT
jgi:hypothetical protein